MTTAQNLSCDSLLLLCYWPLAKPTTTVKKDRFEVLAWKVLFFLLKKLTLPAENNMKPFCVVKANGPLVAFCCFVSKQGKSNVKPWDCASVCALVVVARVHIKPVLIRVFFMSMLHIKLFLHFSEMHVFCNARKCRKTPIPLSTCWLCSDKRPSANTVKTAGCWPLKPASYNLCQDTHWSDVTCRDLQNDLATRYAKRTKQLTQAHCNVMSFYFDWLFHLLAWPPEDVTQ